MSLPILSTSTRPSRGRATPGLRALVRESSLSAAHLVLPVFVTDDPDAVGPIDALPGVARHRVAEVVALGERALAAGIPALLLFGVPRERDAEGSGAWSESSAVAQALRELTLALPELVLISDICLCAYRKDGHCGPQHGRHPGLDSAATATALARMALAHAAAGAHVLAPSAMADGQVATLRQALDQSGFTDRAILAYSAKYASTFYGPFREAARSAPGHGDRRSHQLDPANGREALTEVALDLAEGADFVMVKPALPALDVIARVRDAYPAARLFAYQVSGELAMVRAAAQRGWLDERQALLESLLALRRAGADAVITYAALEVATWLAEQDVSRLVGSAGDPR